MIERYLYVFDDPLRQLEAEGGWGVPPSSRRAVPPEPLRPEPLRVMGDPAAVHPSFAAVYDRLARNFTRLGVPKAERLEALAFELVLEPAEAARGGILPVVLPVFVRCPACRGSGEDWGFTCLRCDGHGIVESEQTLDVRIPPLAAEASVIEVPLEGLGVHNFVLQLRVRIGA